MSFVRPIGDLDWTGPSRETLAEDDARFARLEKYLPPETEIRRRVEEYLRERKTDALEAAFGNPSEIVREVAALERSAERDIHAETLSEEISSILSSLHPEITASDEDFGELVVKSEVRYARQEILRFWVDTLLLARHLAGEAATVQHSSANKRSLTTVSILQLDADDLLPKHAFSSEWPQALAESRQSLRTAVALSDQDLSEVQQSFAKNVKDALREGPIELPDGLEIRLIPGAPFPYVVPRELGELVEHAVAEMLGSKLQEVASAPRLGLHPEWAAALLASISPARKPAAAPGGTADQPAAKRSRTVKTSLRHRGGS